MTKYFVDESGVYIGGFDGAEPPIGSIEVTEAPRDARETWQNGAWTPAPPDPLSRRVTVLAFRNRFTQEEKVKIELAAIDNPDGTLEQRQGAAAIRANLSDIMAANYIDLLQENARDGVYSLEVVGIIGAGRAEEILDGPISGVERPDM